MSHAHLTPFNKKILEGEHHGFDIHIASLRSRKSCGIGEYFDLLPLIDWAKSIGFDVIQLLPVNDSGFDPSPYNALSSCALNPAYLSLRDLPNTSEDFLIQLKRFDRYMNSPYVPYQDVLRHKLDVLYYYYRQNFSKVKEDHAYQQFIEGNPWLFPYATFKVLCDLHHFTSWEIWPEQEKNPTPEFITFFYNKERDRCDFYLFLQYLCFEQMEKVHQVAKEKNVLIKGDLPILISPQSADVWFERDYFDLTKAAGTPPDQYNEEGQYWGFPLYRWKKMYSDHFAFWKRRLVFAEHFYDLYRLDHTVGFFRIWAIEKGGQALDGFFIPDDPATYLSHGKKTLGALTKMTTMLPIGEDLGTIPPGVREIMAHLYICSTKVLRWEKDWEGTGDFLSSKAYPKLSLTTVSTHDSETLTIWWETYPEEAAQFCENFELEYEPYLSYNLREKVLKISHSTSSCFHINLLQEYLNGFTELSWEDPNQERINVPGKVLDTNWTYRYKPFVEEIVNHKSLSALMRRLT